MRFVTGCSLLFVIAISSTAFAASLPTLTVDDENGAVALKIEVLRIGVMIRGHLARTTYEITYRNTLARNVDGDFSFPLPADAEVSDIALYFGKTLRHAVATSACRRRRHTKRQCTGAPIRRSPNGPRRRAHSTSASSRSRPMARRSCTSHTTRS